MLIFKGNVLENVNVLISKKRAYFVLRKRTLLSISTDLVNLFFQSILNAVENLDCDQL